MTSVYAEVADVNLPLLNGSLDLPAVEDLGAGRAHVSSHSNHAVDQAFQVERVLAGRVFVNAFNYFLI